MECSNECCSKIYCFLKSALKFSKIVLIIFICYASLSFDKTSAAYIKGADAYVKYINWLLPNPTKDTKTEKTPSFVPAPLSPPTSAPMSTPPEKDLKITPSFSNSSGSHF